MKLVLGTFCAAAFLLTIVYSEDYYRDENDEYYVIGTYGQRIYPDTPVVDASKFKFSKLNPVLHFAWDLFGNVDQKNFVLAPLSPQILLSFLAKEASGDTRKELKKTVRFSDSEELENLVSDILKEPTSRELKIGNGIFVDLNSKVKKSVWNPEQDLNRQIDVVNTKFSDERATKNSYQNWINQKTKGLIRDINLELDPNTKMLLTSTLYFKGTWQFAFNSTQKTDFHLPDGKVVPVDTMNIRKKYHSGTFDNIDATWAAVPYSSTEAMLLLVPHKGKTLADLKQQMKGTDLTELITVISGQPTKNYLNITMPKFKLNSKIQLREPLEKMGIRKIFSPQSELTLFDDGQQLSVDQAIQQSVLEVDENGSIGASVTAFSVVPLMVQPRPIDSDLVIDRPFVAIIVDRKFGVPYFMAQVTDPRAN